MSSSTHTVTTTEELVANQIIDYSRHALEGSLFFSSLRKQTVPGYALRSVFSQYRFWRDQFHTWFGVCILKSGSCEDRVVCEAVLSLAEHVVDEMRDDHSGMYVKLLRNLGVSDNDLAATEKSNATIAYETSFLRRFGIDKNGFADSVIALSGRELFASIRNGFLIEHLEPYGVRNDRWLVAHQELELDHFYHAIRPFLTPTTVNAEIHRIVDLSIEEIDRHVGYWDALLVEATAAAV